MDFRPLLAEPLFYWGFHNLGAFLWSRFSVGFPSFLEPSTLAEFVTRSSLKRSYLRDFDCGLGSDLYRSEDEASMGPDCNLHAMAVALKPLFYWDFCNSWPF